MPAVDVLTGVAQVNISQRSPGNNVGSMVGVATVVTVITADELLLNSVNQALVSTDNYQVVLAEVGYDVSRKGYTIGRSNTISAIVNTVTAKDVIHVHVAVGNLPAGTSGAIGMMAFLKINGADPQACAFAQVNAANDFDFFITSKPTERAPTFTTVVLAAATANKILGSRNAEQVTWLPFVPTTGGVRLIHKTSQITVRPDDAPDFNVVTTRATDIQFSVLSGDNESIIQAIGGNFVQVTSGGLVYQLSESDIIQAAAQVQGNRAIQVFMPEDSLGRSTTRLYLGNLSTNQNDITENTSKNDQYQIDFNLQAAALDYLTRNLHSTTWYETFAA